MRVKNKSVELLQEIIFRQNDEIQQQKAMTRKNKKTIEILEQDRIVWDTRSFLRLIGFLQRLNEDLVKVQIENRELRAQQQDFGMLLQSKLDEITNELKVERERRVEAEHLCTVK